MSTEAERKHFFEEALRVAERDYRKNNKDSQALTRWGGALLELANFHPGEEASSMVDDAVLKFQQALDIEPNKHDTLWCLGNAYTSQGFLSPQRALAISLFKKAKDCFSTALQQQPENDMYKKGLEMTDRAPELYEEIQRQIMQQGGVVGAAPSGASTFWWDVLGWATFVGLVMGVSTLISMSSPAQPPAPELSRK